MGESISSSIDIEAVPSIEEDEGSRGAPEVEDRRDPGGDLDRALVAACCDDSRSVGDDDCGIDIMAGAALPFPEAGKVEPGSATPIVEPVDDDDDEEGEAATTS